MTGRDASAAGEGFPPTGKPCEVPGSSADERHCTGARMHLDEAGKSEEVAAQRCYPKEARRVFAGLPQLPPLRRTTEQVDPEKRCQKKGVSVHICTYFTFSRPAQPPQHVPMCTLTPLPPDTFTPFGAST